jgi:oligoribonuclease
VTNTETPDTRPTRLLWIDLETTGSDERQDPILEIGAILTEWDAPYDELGSQQMTVRPKGEWAGRMDHVVTRMHTVNGLLAEVFREDPSGAEDYMTIDEADRIVVEWLASHGLRPHEVVIAGSGVGHFDRRFIAAQMPKLDKWLRYYVVDVGAIRRFIETTGRTDLLYERPTNKAHRAMDDIVDHLTECRHYAKAVQSI